MSFFRLTLSFVLGLVATYSLPNPAKAQPESSISKEEFLGLYREALPKLEVALFRNKSIDADLTSYNPLDQTDKSIWRRKMTYRSNHDRFILSVTTLKPENTTVRILRPDHIYVLGKSSAGPYLIGTDRTIPEEASAPLTSVAWWSHPQIQSDNGIGHGAIFYEEDWYTSFATDSLLISTATETNDSGRRCYRVTATIEKNKNTTNWTIYFDKTSLMVFHAIGDRTLQDGSRTYFEEVLDFDMKPGDYDSIVIKNYKFYSENKQLKLPRHLSQEHTFTVYKTMTHPPETFRLEQFGLPDVAERPRATSRRSLGLIAAGVTLGVFLLVAWSRGRRSAKTA